MRVQRLQINCSCFVSSPEMIETFGGFFADCAELLKRFGGTTPAWSELNKEAQAILLGRYFDYLLRVQHTQNVLIDSNDLILTREVDTTSSLEPFKSLHRYIDALSAFEDMTAKRLENDRIRARLQSNLLGDPNVDRVTVVSTRVHVPPNAIRMGAFHEARCAMSGVWFSRMISPASRIVTPPLPSLMRLD